MAKLLATAQGDVHVTPEGSRAIEWYYDTDTCEFVADQQQIMSAFHLPHPINGIDDLLKHSRTSQIEEIKQKIVDSETSEEDGFLSCCLMPNPGVLVLVDIRFERLNDHEIRGILIPQVCISGLEDIANILDTVFDLPNVGISVADQNLCIIGCNSAFQYQMGYLRDELIGEKTSFFRSEQHGEEFYEQLWKEIDSKGYWNGSLMSRTKNGSNQVHYHSIYRINFISGQTLYFDFCTDISTSLLWKKINAGENRGQFSAFLPPRKEFEEQLVNLAQSSRSKNISVVITFRPAFSSQSRLEQQLCFSDYIMRSRHVSLSGQLSRDVFAICLQTPQCQWLSPLRLIQMVLRGFLADLKNEVGSSVYSTIVEGQTGVAVLGYDAQTAGHAIAHAAQAMVSSSADDRSYFNFYSSELHSELVKRFYLEDFLHKVIENEAVDVYFQPIVEVSTGNVVKFEALARFSNETETFDTQEMIAIIEDLELISALDDVVCKSALSQLPDIQGIYGAEVGLTINRSLNTKLNALQVLQSSFEIILESGVNPSNITIELTETAYFEQDQEHSVALEQIRKLGIDVAIDDFGTGYSSFAYLKEDQFDLVKIDRKFIKDIVVDSISYNIVKMITELAHKLNVKVVAEGVESEQELNVLTSIGVDYMQGFLFSPAVPLSAFKTKISYETLFDNVVQEQVSESPLLTFCHSNIRRLKQNAPLSLAMEFVNLQPQVPLLVMDSNRCIGLVTKERLEQYLSAEMEANTCTKMKLHVWEHPLSKIMDTEFASVSVDSPVSTIKENINVGCPFPWVLCDSQNEFRGLLTQEDVLSYLASV